MAARPGPRQSRPRSEAHYGPERGTTYLLHFERPYRHAEHYRGWTSRPIAERLAEHLRGEGSVLTRAVVQAGIGIVLARTWPNTTKDREDSLKHQGGARRCCPQCGIKPAASRLASDRLPEQAPERLSLYELDRLGTTSDGEPLPIVTAYPSRGAAATAAPREENDMFGRKAATPRPEAAGQPPNHAQQIATERAGRLLHGELADPQGYLGDRRRSLSEVARSYLSRIDSARHEKGLPELTGVEQDDIIGRADRGGFIDGADQFPEAGDMPDWLPRDGHIDELAQQRAAAVTQRGGPDHLAEMADDEREQDGIARQVAEIEAAEAAARDAEELQEWRPQGEAVIAAVDRWSDTRVQAGQAEQQLRDAERAEQAALQAHDPDAADIARADRYAARERLAAARAEVAQRDREYHQAEEEQAGRVDPPGAGPGRDAVRWSPALDATDPDRLSAWDADPAPTEDFGRDLEAHARLAGTMGRLETRALAREHIAQAAHDDAAAALARETATGMRQTRVEAEADAYDAAAALQRAALNETAAGARQASADHLGEWVDSPEGRAARQADLERWGEAFEEEASGRRYWPDGTPWGGNDNGPSPEREASGVDAAERDAPGHLYGAPECTEPDPEGDHFGSSPVEPRDAGQFPATYGADPFRLSGPASPEPYANYPQAELEAGA